MRRNWVQWTNRLRVSLHLQRVQRILLPVLVSEPEKEEVAYAHSFWETLFLKRHPVNCSSVDQLKYTLIWIGETNQTKHLPVIVSRSTRSLPSRLYCIDSKVVYAKRISAAKEESQNQATVGDKVNPGMKKTYGT